MKTPSFTPDPNLVAQQEDAKKKRNEQIQSSLSDDFMQMQKNYGARNAMVGAGMMSAPLTTVAGGFSSPPLGALARGA